MLDKIKALGSELEELAVLTWLETEGVLLTDFISAKVLNKIKANSSKQEDKKPEDFVMPNFNTKNDVILELYGGGKFRDISKNLKKPEEAGDTIFDFFKTKEMM